MKIHHKNDRPVHYTTVATWQRSGPPCTKLAKKVPSFVNTIIVYTEL